MVVARCGDRVVAEEITAQTLESAAEQFARGRGDEVSPAWLTTVALRRLVDHWRRSARSSRLNQRVAEVHPAEVEPRVEDETIRAAVDSLPTRQRAVIALRYLDDWSVAETADALGLTYRATESLLGRARRSLRTAWKETTRTPRPTFAARCAASSETCRSTATRHCASRRGWSAGSTKHEPAWTPPDRSRRPKWSRIGPRRSIPETADARPVDAVPSCGCCAQRPCCWSAGSSLRSHSGRTLPSATNSRRRSRTEIREESVLAVVHQHPHGHLVDRFEGDRVDRLVFDGAGRETTCRGVGVVVAHGVG